MSIVTDHHHQPQPAPRAGVITRRAAMAGPLGLLVVLLGAVAANPALRQMLGEAVRSIDPRAVLVVLPVQFLAILLCTAAQQALRVGIPFGSSLIARLVRDAAHNLLIFPPGLGEAVGARVVVLLGGRGRAAVALRALDIAAEVIAELPYMALAFWVLWHWWHGGNAVAMPDVHVAWRPEWTAALLLPVAAYVGWRVWRASSHHQHWIQTRTGRRVRAETHLMRRELARQKAGLPLAIALHVVAWGLSGVQVWLAAQVFGLHLSLFGALAIESAATSARVILFFVPGGLVMQEAGAVLAGAALGVAAPQALALSLVLRLRDVVFGVALGLWPWLEYRARRNRQRQN
ncbi:MAG TPA: lysylphosphatidylglycerol synthase domain-containing protein [Novosphingobium sp.]|nr:lysylphosphatidylglycerol synthase domain-containing protein [Novosphingobium sp.]